MDFEKEKRKTYKPKPWLKVFLYFFLFHAIGYDPTSQAI